MFTAQPPIYVRTGQNNEALAATCNFTDIAGGYAKHHLSPHLEGRMPLGGNLAMLDGHAEWRKFGSMQPRTYQTSASPVFWW